MQPLDIKKEIGKRIRELREMKGFTQKKLSDITKIDEQQISRYERGESMPRQKTINKLVEYGDFPPDFFMISEHQIEPYETKAPERRKIHADVERILESENEAMIELFKSNTRAILSAVRDKKNNKDKGDD